MALHNLFLFRVQDGQTALMWAAQNGHADCVRLLLDAGADKNAKNEVRASAVVARVRVWGWEMLMIGCCVWKCAICIISIVSFFSIFFCDFVSALLICVRWRYFWDAIWESMSHFLFLPAFDHCLFWGLCAPDRVSATKWCGDECFFRFCVLAVCSVVMVLPDLVSEKTSNLHFFHLLFLTFFELVFELSVRRI